MNVWTAVFLLASFVLSTTISKPVEDVMDSNDSQAVGSNINKVYAPAPFDDLQVAGTGEKKHEKKGHESQTDDENSGYYTSKSTKGDNGYKHFDSYHKKGGDKYGFEKHSSYGKGTGGKKGGSYQTSSAYHEADADDKGSESESYSGEGTEVKNKKVKNKKAKDPKTAATDGDFHFSNYESEGDGDSEHIEGDEGHYEDEGGYYESYSEGGESDSEGYYDGEGEGESEAYYEGEGESRQKSVIHHGGPAPGATSYSVRHFN